MNKKITLERAAMIALLFCLAVLVFALSGFIASSRSVDLEAHTGQNPLITKQTVVHVQTYYPRCGHTEEQVTAGNSAFANMDAATLAQFGWQLVWQEGEAYLRCEKEGYCFSDAQKRHLRIHENKISVFAGPLQGQGDLLYQLEIPLSAIPARWLAQLTIGGIEFPNEETLLMALDNIDEMLEFQDES